MKMKLLALNYYKILKHFTIGIDVLFAFLLLFNYLDFLPEFWGKSIVYIFFFVVAINTAFLALKVKQMPEHEKEHSSIVYLSKYFFLLGLIVIVLNQFLKREIIIDYMSYITGIVITLGFLTFYSSRDKVEKEIEDEKQKEDADENKRKDEFEYKFPRLSKLDIKYGFSNVKNIREVWKKILVFIGLVILSPIIFIIRLPYKLVKWMYKEGWGYILILVLILIMFTAIKYPYFGVSFTGEHAMKYNSFVEPAKYMLEQNNPFWNQVIYQTDPLNRPTGVWKTFGNLPIIEWGLLITYDLFPNNSLEFNTRLFTNLLGVLILIFGYLFFTKWFTKSQALIIIFLMAINPIINFTSFVTVEDSLLIIFTFLSLLYLSKYLQENNISHLFFTGLFFGIGVSVKYSIFLWLLPIIFILLVYKSRDFNYLIKSLGIIGILTLLPTLSFRTSLRYLPTNAILSGLSFIVWIILFYFLYSFVIKKEKGIDIFINKLSKHKILLIGTIALLIGLSIAFILMTKIYLFFNEFLTDSKLIFNYDMYNYMLNKQFKPYMTDPVYYFGLISFVFSLFFGLKKQRVILLSFFIGAAIYWVLASKVIFFHNYYTNIILITFCLGVGIMIYLLGKSFRNKYIFIITIILIALLIAPTSYEADTKLLSKERDVSSLNQVAQYLIENTDEYEMYIDESDTPSLTISTNRGMVGGMYMLYTPEFKYDVKTLGFKDAMDKYNIKYLITFNKEPFYNNYANIFSNISLLSTSYRRSDIISDRIFGYNNYFSDQELRNKIIEEYKIKEKFQLEKQIGSYKLFTFNN